MLLVPLLMQLYVTNAITRHGILSTVLLINITYWSNEKLLDSSDVSCSYYKVDKYQLSGIFLYYDLFSKPFTAFFAYTIRLVLACAGMLPVTQLSSHRNRKLNTPCHSSGS
jgi:hypothetical protein